MCARTHSADIEARSDLTVAPLYMAGSDLEATKARFAGVKLPILVDPSGYINLLVDTPATACKLVRSFSTLSI